jgi:hypothetical protein
MVPMNKELNLPLLLLGGLICAVAAVAAPYVTLKLGLGLDLTMGGMFLAAAVLGGKTSGKQLAVQLNIVQTMVSASTGVAFMVVILAAFYYLQADMGADVVQFNPTWWQMSIWLLVSSSLGIFLGAIMRRMVLDDRSLPWPTGHVGKSVVETLSDPNSGEIVERRKKVLTVSTLVSGAITYFRDGFGVLPALVGNGSYIVALAAEPAIIGLGMVLPLSVGLSGLLGVWVINSFGDTLSMYGALSGTAPESIQACVAAIQGGEVTEFIRTTCGDGAAWMEAGSRFKYLVKWTMWPATAMMIAAALTSVLVPLIGNLIARSSGKAPDHEPVESLADEQVSMPLMLGGMAACVLLLLIVQGLWFAMPWYQVLLAVALQPLLIVAGLRVLGLTGSGPVSLMANATQFVFGLIWPNSVQQNLNAAHISADPQASSEGTVAAFWVARRIGGSFNVLIVVQFVAVAIAALLIPMVFNLLVATYGIGFEEGQLSAPTALKISSLAKVMSMGLGALPYGALAASIWAAVFGVVAELVLMVRRRGADGKELLDEKGNSSSRFGWVPIPSAFGFALILPPSLSIGLAVGSMISAVWRAFSTDPKGSYATYGAPLAAGGVAGEAMVGGIAIPVLTLLTTMSIPWFFGLFF